MNLSIEELIEKALVGLDGKMFYMGLYQGETYISSLVNGIFVIYSKSPINSKSRKSKYRNYYFTDMKIKELDYITGYTMYVTYKGNEYEVISASIQLKSFLIQGREDHVDEDLALGFDREMYKNMSFDKRIAYEEAESIRIESRDVYLELLEKYGGR